MTGRAHPRGGSLEVGHIRDRFDGRPSPGTLWSASVFLGADTFVEAGPGKTLCGFNKRIDRSLKSMNVENIETLEKTLDYLREVR